MTHCEHDEYAHKHALTIVGDDYGQPLVTGVECRHTVPNRLTPLIDSVSFGGNFSALITVNTNDHHLCHYIDGKMYVTAPPIYISDLYASNTIADYVLIYDNIGPFVIRLDRHKKCTKLGKISKTLLYCGYRMHVSISADDLFLMSSRTLDNKQTYMNLFDVTTECTIRDMHYDDKYKRAVNMTAHSKNVWVSDAFRRRCINIYDYRAPEWMVTTHFPKTRALNDYCSVSSCVDDIVLFSVRNRFEFGSPAVICALDLRNGDNFDLANICGHADPVHLQL